VIERWQRDTHNVNALADELRRQLELVNGGDLSRAEGMLIAQAHTLDSIFAHLARRATVKQFLPQWEAYMRMAMKAQNQCRMTLETLATIKNPPVVYARQANINNGGQQQVNNGCVPAAEPVHASAANAPAAPTELLEVTDGQRLDAGAAGSTVGGDPQLAPVGKLNGTKNC
jgi:hypothetical protein